ncbi:hypothetical protein SRHO_G00269350 [Serrasalmus rhombeus]
MTKSLSEGCSTLEIAKILGRDHRTIKRFVANSQQGRKKRAEKKKRKITAKDLRRIKREATRNPLSSTSVIFQNCNLAGVSRSTRCSALRDMAKALPALRPLSCGGAAAPLVRCGWPPLALRKAVLSVCIRPISTERKWRTKCGGDRVVDTADSQITFVMCTDQDLL